MKQPLLAPVATGGAILTGISAMLIGGYRIADCLRYNYGYGVCDEVVEENTLSLVAGGAAIAGSIGGLFTYNRRLERPSDSVANMLPIKERVIAMSMEGKSQREISETLGISRYQVRKNLKS